MTHRWPSRFAAFVLWSLATVSAMAWLLKVMGSDEAPVTAGAIEVQAPVVAVQDLARALGPDAPQAVPSPGNAPQQQAQDPSARLRLLGVVAGRRTGGVALISVDGQSARPYRVGSAIDTGYRLTGVAARSATLAPTQADGPSITLELPPLDAAATPPPAARSAVSGRLPDLARTQGPQPAALPAAGGPPAANTAPADNNDEARKD
jgi:general secretion pathway protein C